MKRLFAKSALFSRIAIGLGATLLVGAGLLMVMAFLRPGLTAPEPEASEPTAQPTTAVPASPTPEPSPTASPVVAKVNEYTITRTYLERATALNQVLSEFAGQDPLGQMETLQRLIKQQLVLQGAPPENHPSEADVEDYIGRMQEAWSIEEETMVSELEAVGVERAFLEETIERLLSVQTATEQLREQGHDINTWLTEQEKDADIRVLRELSEVPSEEAEVEPTPLASEGSADAPPTATPAPQPEVPSEAPDFTLEQAGGGSLTLSEQLKEGPVVLVFFQRCG